MNTPQISVPELLNAYQWRAAQPEDAPALNRFLLEIEAVDQRQWVDTLDDRQRDFKAPDSNPEIDTILALTVDNRIAAMGWVFCPPDADKELQAFLWGEVHPEHRQRGLGNFILSWMEERGREILKARPENLPAFLRASSSERLIDRIELLKSHNFKHVRSFYRMRRNLGEPIPETQAIKNIVILPWEVQYDPQALQVLNDAFRDHWGFSPVNEELWRLFLSGHPDFRADLSFMAFHQKEGRQNTLVGICLNKIYKTENEALKLNEGWIQELAVLRPWRKMGIATSMLCASMKAFQSDGQDYAGLGVDTENLTGALRIYEQVGFSPIQSFHTYSKNV